MISVVVPAYNESIKDLRRTLVSIWQTVDDAEVIVIDDGSTEPVDPIEVATGSPATSTFVVERLEPNRGPAAALNVGYDLATNDYIARLDVGDIWFPRAKRSQIDRVIAKSEPASFSRCVDEVSHDTRPLAPHWAGAIYRDNQFQLSTSIVAKSTWQAIRFDESLRYCDDWDWSMRVQHAVGWTCFNMTTGTATAWPKGHSAPVDADLIARRTADRKRVYANGERLRLTPRPRGAR